MDQSTNQIAALNFWLLLQAAMHEIGHALGLRHSKLQHNIMNPHYIDTEVKLGQDDIDGIQKLYGKCRSLNNDLHRIIINS